jgi:hypothetical protein
MVEQSCEASYWTSNHEGSGGRYFFNHPNQPHFVFETSPGGTITNTLYLP